MDVAARFWLKVGLASETECWPWLAGKFPGGYGSFRFEGRMQPAHRVAWVLSGHSLVPGLQLDHTCHNGSGCPGGRMCPHRACVNPTHLEQITHAENVLRGEGLAAQQARQTNCRRGHDLTDPANLKPNSRGARQCRVCSNISRRDRYQRLGR